MKLSPIVLFVYNRPEHTKKTIEALQKNELAKDSELFIYSDGPKNEDIKEKVNEVREYIKGIQGFKKITIIERDKNFGLANNMIQGVSEIFNTFEKVIVLEDDLVTSKYFLKFMNSTLEFYNGIDKIFVVSGYSHNVKIPKKYFYDVYSSYRSSSWGWGTWKDRWLQIDWEVKDYEDFIKDKKKIKEFDKSGGLSKMLKNQMEGRINSWAIRRTYNQFKLGKYTIFPVVSLVKNIGMDGSGTHYNKKSIQYVQQDGIKFGEFNKDYKFLKEGLEPLELVTKQIRKKTGSKNIFFRIIRKIMKAFIKYE